MTRDAPYDRLPASADVERRRGLATALVNHSKSLAIRPADAGTLRAHGSVMQQLKRFREAITSYERALAINPDNPVLLRNRGDALFSAQHMERALQSYNQSLALGPDDFATLNNRGSVLQALKRHDAALTSYDRALAVNPQHAGALNNRSNVLEFLDRCEEALLDCQLVIALHPDLAWTFSKRADLLRKLKHVDQALVSYERALAITPHEFTILNNCGVLQQQLKHFTNALLSYAKALSLNPSSAEILYNSGNIFHELRRFGNALASYERVLSIQPGHSAAFNNRGNTLLALSRFEDALLSYERSLSFRPADNAALTNRGNALMELRRFDEALVNYNRALALQPDESRAFSGLANCALNICDWARRGELAAELVQHVRKQISIIGPFCLLGYSDDPELHLLCAKTYVRRVIHVPLRPIWHGEVWRNHKIKLAYISADFHRHPTTYLMAELFATHDRRNFEVNAISFGPDDGTEARTRLTTSFDGFFDVRTKSDYEVACLLHSLKIDIAIDLKGHTKNARLGIFAYRPAPIQVTYLGFPGTTGADFIDYIIADAVVLPQEQQCFYSEAIVHLPNCYQANESQVAIASHTPSRTEAGLPEDGFVFCCFNNSWKITPAMFDIWMRLLLAVQGSVLWLLGESKEAKANLCRAANDRGVDPKRLIFAQPTTRENHLGRVRLADLFLDTLPYNAHTTASDALRMGLPVLTCRGNAFAGRVAASLLTAVGLPEFVMHTLGEYEAFALRLGLDPDLIAGYRNRLARNQLSHPLFDSDRFREHMEAAYQYMWQLWQHGKRPRSFEVGQRSPDYLGRQLRDGAECVP